MTLDEGRCPECGSETASGCGADWHDSAPPNDDKEAE